MQTSEFLKINRERILTLWEKEVREKFPSIVKDNRSVLRDSLPDFLENLAHALMVGVEEKKESILAIAQEHGSKRARLSDYTIEEALEEFHILRRAVFHVLEEDTPLPRAERDIVYEVIGIGLTNAGKEFYKSQILKKERLEERFRLALEGSEMGLWEFNSDTEEIYFSKEEANLYEFQDSGYYHIEDILSRVHSEDKEKVLSLFFSDSNEGIFTREFRICLPGNREKWLFTRGKNVFSSNGRILRKIAIDRDISERRLAEHKLEQAALRLRHITDIQPSLISFVDKDYRYRFVNHSYEKLFNRKRSDFLGKKIWETMGEKAWETIRHNVEKAMSGEVVVYETTLPLPPGDKFMKVHLKPSINEQSQVEGIFVSVMDITEQIETLNALKKSEEELRDMSNAIPQLAWMADPNGFIYWFNKRWYDYTGATKENSLGSHWKRFHHPDHREKTFRHFQQSIREGREWEDTFPIKNTLGQYRWFLSRAIPIRDENGKVTKWFGTNTDVTDQKKITDELHREQNLRDRFIYTLSHDLRTPLTAAKMAAQIIPRKIKDPDTIIKHSGRIIKNIDRADKMIQDLLDASRLKAGQLIKPEIQEFSFMELIQVTLEDLKSIFGDRFTLSVHKEINVYSWPQGISRIIENLTSNAIKYGASDRNINISVLEKKDYIILSVHNYGDPIEKGVNIFSEFQRAPSAQKSSKKGWGIGLTIVRGITESLGGEVQWTSDNNGNTFSIILPKDSRNKIPTHQASENHH